MAQAETNVITVATEFGMNYLPLIVMQQRHLIERRAAAGMPGMRVNWLRFANGGAMNDALLSNQLQFAPGGWRRSF